MSSSIIIACISSAIRWKVPDVGESCDELNRNLRLLRTFVLCGKKLLRDSRFSHFLKWIEENLWKNTVELHNCCNFRDASSVAGNFEEFTYSLQEEMEYRYDTMLEGICTAHSTSLMTDEILEIISSILEITTLKSRVPDLFEKLYPLNIQMRFLKSFLQFVTNGNTEASKDLLAHSETVVINTAYILFHYLYIIPDGVSSPGKDWEEMLSQICEKLLKPINPQVYEIYTQSLSASKLSKQFLDDDALLAAKNFLDSLMSILADIIGRETRRIGSMKDQLQELYERLVSLKIILRQQQIANFDMKIQKAIVDLVIDAGILICSFYHQPQMYVNFGYQDLLKKFEIVLSKVSEMDPKIPIFNLPRTSSYGFVDYILEKLKDLTISEAESTSKSHVETIQVELASIRSTLSEVVGLYDEHVEVQILWDRVLEVALKLESAIDYHGIDPFSNSFSASFDYITLEISSIKADMLKIEVKETRSKTYSHLPSEITPSTPNEVIGFHDEERAVLDRLLGGPKHLQLIPIVGMPGVGKTTLASKVYNHSSLSYHFLAKAWCHISQVLDKKKVIIHLLKQIGHAMPCEMSENNLANTLRRNLKGKRYLIFLDDIWNTEAWNTLKGSFPDDNKGSRIIFTSRCLDVAPGEMLDQEPLVLRPLSDTYSLKLMGSKLFPGQEYDFPPALHDLGMKIVARCGGLPLAIIIVAGVLANAEVGDWEGILDSFNFLSSEGNCRYTLEFSYRHLLDYLKPCFLYFGAFPEDQEVYVRRLLRLWIAEGFVRKSKTSSLEDVAEGYLNMLIQRSLVMGAKRRSDGRVKKCHIHDLLRDFCLEKARDEHFFHFAKGSDELRSFKEPPNLRRLLIDCEPEALRESNVYCPQARSLLLRGSGKFYEGMSPALQFFKQLKVLDLEHIDFGDIFPAAIEQLVFLAFLALRGGDLTVPSWLANLSNLETLILRFRVSELSLPDDLWNMPKLKYICLRGSFGMVGVLPINNLDNSSVLYELDRFKGAIIDWCNMEKQLRKFPNIRKLKCLINQSKIEEECVDMFVFPDFLHKLESLDMSGSKQPNFGVRFEFSSLKNLKRLKLSELCLYWEIFSVIGNHLPSLEVLKLWGLKFKGEEEYTWEMKKGEFTKLRILHVGNMPFRRWIACDDHEFDCFQKLVLKYCSMLVELPSCLETIETLEEIVIRHCSEAVEDLVTNIEEEQNVWGNSGLKITRHHTQR